MYLLIVKLFIQKQITEHGLKQILNYLKGDERIARIQG